MSRLRQNDCSPDTQRVYAWLSRDEDGQEGIIAVPTMLGVTALVATDQERAMKLLPAAQFAARERGFPAKLVIFERGEVLQEELP